MKNYHVYAFITIVFWSLAFILTRLALAHFSVFSLGFLRYCIASLCLLPLVALLKMRLPTFRDLPFYIASGATGFFLYMIFFNLGQGRVSAAIGSLIIATAPVLTALIACFVDQERLSWPQWAAICVEFSGIVILTTLGRANSINIAGVGWLLLAAVCLSAYNILQRRLTKSQPPIQAATFSIFTGAALLALFSPRALPEICSASSSQLLYLAILGIGSSAIAYVTWTKAFALAAKTAHVSNYMFLTPFLATGEGFILAGEAPDAATIIGGCVILAGMLIFNLAESRSGCKQILVQKK